MSKLFESIRIGALNLTHRVVLPPLTRMRSEMPGNVPGDAMVEYYAQRATCGGLLIAEATYVTRQGNGGYVLSLPCGEGLGAGVGLASPCLALFEQASPQNCNAIARGAAR